MLAGMEEFIGRTLTQSTISERPSAIEMGYIVTRPDFCGPNTHINMFIRFDKNFKITSIDGDKCYSHYTGLYNRSASVKERSFTARELAYLKRFIKQISE